MDKKVSRIRRAKKFRSMIKEKSKHRLVVHRSSKHMYAQIIDKDFCVIAASSTLSSSLKSSLSYTGNVDAAKSVGKDIAEKAIAKGVKSVAFDRSGFKYHGRVAALAASARESGLQF